MVIKSLKLINYRSYKDKTFNFSDKLNILVGKMLKVKQMLLKQSFMLSLEKVLKHQKKKRL
mgnify:CR=1 FL=1